MINIIEKYAPYVITVIGGGLALSVSWWLDIEAIPDALIAGTMTLGIVIAGFSATQRNMLFSMRQSRVIRRAIKINQMDHVWSYVSRTLFGGIVLTVISFIGFFINDNVVIVRIWITVLSALVCWTISYLALNEIIMTIISKRYIEEHS